MESIFKDFFRLILGILQGDLPFQGIDSKDSFKPILGIESLELFPVPAIFFLGQPEFQGISFKGLAAQVLGIFLHGLFYAVGPGVQCAAQPT